MITKWKRHIIAFAKVIGIMMVSTVLVINVTGNAFAENIKDAAPLAANVNPNEQAATSVNPPFTSDSGINTDNDNWSSHAFSGMMWFAGVGVGIAAFLLFLYLNKKMRSSRDWVWPLLPILFLGYVIVFGPLWVSDEIYENWSVNCLNKDAAPTSRTPQEGSSDALCWRAQTDHSALGYGFAVSEYRKHILNGTEEMLTPDELKRLAWLLLVAWATAIYFAMLKIRNRFFVT